MNLDRAEKLAAIFSLVAVPFVVGAGQWWIQDRIADAGIRQQYVQLAIGIIRDPPRTSASDERPPPQDLRAWAVSIVDQYAPVPLTKDAKEALIQQGLSGFDFQAFDRSSFDQGSWQLMMPALTVNECQKVARFMVDSKAWLERCLARATDRSAETAK